MHRLLQKKYFRIAIFLVILPLALVYFFYRVRVVFLPFLMAMLIAYILNPLVAMLERKKFSRSIAIITVYAFISIIMAVVVIYGIPEIMDELNKLAGAIPQLTSALHDIGDAVQTRYSRFALPDSIRQVIDEKLISMQEELLVLAREAAGGIISMFSYLLSLMIAPVFAYYMLKDLDNIRKYLVDFIPRAWRSDTLAVFRDIDEIIGKYLRGNITVAFVVGVLTGLGMFLIDVKFAFIIGFISGLADLIPYFGPIIGAAPAIALALLESKTRAMYAVLVILAVQYLENSVLAPKVLGESLGLHPLLVIFVLLAGGELYGLTGMLLAVPATAITRVIFRYLYLKLIE